MTEETQPQTKKKRKRKKKVNYFTSVHEDAIVAYNQTTDPRQRDKIYRGVIRPVLIEMINKIVARFKFNNIPNIDSLKRECETYLITIISNYDKGKGKAFGYLSVVIRNFFYKESKNNVKSLKSNIKHEDITKAKESEFLSIENNFLDEINEKEKRQQLWMEIHSWENKDLKENERKVLEAIKILLADPDRIYEEGGIFNKKGVYLYIRELTKLNTKQVLSNLNKFRVLYRDFKYKWDNEV